jgi:hypothetical protein
MSLLFHGSRSPRIVAAAGLTALTLLPVTTGVTPPPAPDGGAPAANATMTAARSCYGGFSKTPCPKLRARRRFLQTHV